MASRRDTPAMRQYDAFKKRYPECVLFFRMGDFYEMFDEDAVLAHRVLGITLTQRTEGIPMAGVPYHSVENYLRRMIDAGHRVAVCEQIEDPKEAKGVVERAVTRVLTPGTLVDDSLLPGDQASSLAAVAFLDAGEEPSGRVVAAVIEVSTGAFTVFETIAASIIDELARRNISELLYAEALTGIDREPPPRIKRLTDALGVPFAARPAWHFRPAEATEALRKQFGVTTFAGFGLADDDAVLIPAGVVVRYLSETQAVDAAPASSDSASSGTAAAAALRLLIRERSLGHLQPPKRDNPASYLAIDAVSLRALDIERTLRRDGAEGSLLSIFASAGNAPKTPMGRRLLVDWLKRPLLDRAAILARQAGVEALVHDRAAAAALQQSLTGVQDLPRIAARISLARATPRDLVALARSLSRIGGVTLSIQSHEAFAAHAATLRDLESSLAPVAAEITRTCIDDPPAHMREGGLVRDGVDPVLDEARQLQTDSHTWLAEHQKTLIERHDLPSLKVGYNKVFGYYIELPAAQARRAPAEFTRKQTLKNAERYITPELKAFEEKVLSASDRAIQREIEIFTHLCSRVGGLVVQIGRCAQALAELDVLLCFAAKATHKSWTRPEIVDEPILDIRQGRHPVLEELLADQFVPNDLSLGSVLGAPRTAPSASLALLTGPNMAGKSTFIRQVALITLLAHTGSFVPAQFATVGLTDRIFTRIGADDALHQGQSTFMVEMIETANILHHATPRSLVILDEIGRGTSTLDGLSLAWAIAERLAGGDEVSRCQGAKVPSETAPAHSPAPSTPRTLFATHYHELTTLEERLPGSVINLHVAVREWGDEVVFLHRILPGRADRSYGIHVAKLAGLPRDVIKRAGELLESLSVSHEGSTPAAATPAPPAASHLADGQLPLFREFLPHPAIEELKKLDLDHLTPMQAFDRLRELRTRVHETQR